MYWIPYRRRSSVEVRSWVFRPRCPIRMGRIRCSGCCSDRTDRRIDSLRPDLLHLGGLDCCGSSHSLTHSNHFNQLIRIVAEMEIPSRTLPAAPRDRYEGFNETKILKMTPTTPMIRAVYRSNIGASKTTTSSATGRRPNRASKTILTNCKSTN